MGRAHPVQGCGLNPRPRPRPPTGHLCLHGDAPRGQVKAQVRHPLDSPAGARPGLGTQAAACTGMWGAGAPTSTQKGALVSLVLTALWAPCLHRTTPPPATAPPRNSETRAPGGGLCGSERSPPPLLRPQAESLMLDGLCQLSGHWQNGYKWTVCSAWGRCFHEDSKKH